MAKRPEEGIQPGDYDRLGGWATLIAALITGIGTFLMFRANAPLLAIVLVPLPILGISLGGAFYMLKYPKSFVRDVLGTFFRQGG